MKIAVVLRQLPDLIEPLSIDPSGKAVDLEFSSFIINEYDEHALEQALLLKEESGGEVVVVALDYGDVEQTLYSAAAKGADQVIKIAYEEEQAPKVHAAVQMYTDALREINADLVLIGAQSYDELEGNAAPLLAMKMNLPYVGLIQGVERGADPSSILVYKEFPGAAREKLKIKLPALLGILTAAQPPRYVPVSRIRGMMKSFSFDEKAIHVPTYDLSINTQRLYPPETGEKATMLEGDEQTVANKIKEILREKGVIK